MSAKFEAVRSAALRSGGLRTDAARRRDMCGSATHPGGGIMGAPGKNAAGVLLADMKRRRA
ncbi:MAG TPA: hypothetical protein VE007_01640 [Thermoanaerobaculia bacterium]|nr:hypothetical protein [Thermoanaerobaculia bacterium]